MQAAWPPAECTCAQIQMIIKLGTLSFGHSMCHQCYAQRPFGGVADTLDCPVSCMAMRLHLPCTETFQMVLDRPCVHSRVLAAVVCPVHFAATRHAAALSSPSAVCSMASGSELAKAESTVCWLSHVMLLHCTP
jgi:hypothetical protein